VGRRRTFARRPPAPAWRISPSVYRGAAGFREHFYLAELDEDHQVVRRVGPTYTDAGQALIAYAHRADPRLRLVREITVREIAA
jgi:hypothetical protein